MGAPLIVEQLAATVSGVPWQWKEFDTHWVVIMTDGRKYKFPKDEKGVPRSQETVETYKPAVEVQPKQKSRKRDRAD